MKTAKKAFTLVELLITLLITLIFIVGILIPLVTRGGGDKKVHSKEISK